MIFGKGKRDNGVPVWMRWAVIGVLVYLVFVGYKQQPSSLTGQEDATSLSSSDADRISRAAKATNINKDIISGLHGGSDLVIGGNIEGRGAPAYCGELATVDVDALAPDGVDITAIDSELIKPVRDAKVTVGSNNNTMPWAKAVVGMKKGGIREASINASKLWDQDQLKSFALNRNDIFRYRINLKDLFPANPDDQIPFRASDIKVGNGPFVRCGSTVSIRMTVWNAKGERIYKSPEPFSLTVGGIGSSRLVYGIDRGLVGMKNGGIRHLTIPPAYLKMHEPGFSKFQDINERQKALSSDTVLNVDIEVESIKSLNTNN